jgi:hypothetical protein
MALAIGVSQDIMDLFPDFDEGVAVSRDTTKC